MKRLLLLISLFTTPLLAQVAPINGYCTLGASQAQTSGLPSSNYMQGIIPYCRVSIYYTGTPTLVPGTSVFRDSIGTVLGNPFTANADGSFLFYISFLNAYDIVLSGGVVPNVYSSPKTLTNIIAGQAGVGCVSGGSISQGCTGATTAAGALANLGVQPYSVLSSGADPTGVADSTAALNAAYTHSPYIVIPPGIYAITCLGDTDHQYRHGGVRVPSNTATVIAAGATITCAVNTTGYYNAFVAQNAQNVIIQNNGVLDGNKAADLAAGAPVGSQWGFGVVFSGCTTCSLTGNGTIQNFLGDAVIVDRYAAGAVWPSDIYLGPLTLTASYRNNVSIINSTGTVILNHTTLTNAAGTAPQAGIDIEPGGASNHVGTVILDGVTDTGNAAWGVSAQAPSGSGIISDVQITGGLIDQNGVGLIAYGSGIQHFKMIGAKVSNSSECGALVSSVVDGSTSVTGNLFVGNGSGSSTPDCSYSGAEILSSAGVEFTGNTIRVGANSHPPIYGLHLNSNTGVNRIYDNDLAGSAATTSATDEFHVYSESATDYYSGNRLTSGMQVGKNENIGASSLTIGAGQSLTGNHGTQAYVQHSDGAACTNGLTAYNADGSTTCPAIPITGTGATQAVAFPGTASFGTTTPTSIGSTGVTFPDTTIQATAAPSTIVLASAMSQQTASGCTNITGMTWNLAASKNYVLSCEVPTTFASSATIAFCLAGPGSPTSYSLDAFGAIGAAAVFGDYKTLAQTSWGTKTTASGAPGATTQWIHVKATIQNGSTASGTALTLQTAANGTNAITVLANASCALATAN